MPTTRLSGVEPMETDRPSDGATSAPEPSGSPDAEPRAEPLGDAGTSRRLLVVHAGLRLVRLGPVLILALLVLVMSGLSPYFATTQNLGNVLAQSAVIAILAIGQLLVILTRGIDLSVGSTLALSAVAGALVFQSMGGGATTVAVMVATGAAVGAVNGVVFVFGRLPHPFIITLATLSIARGLALHLSGGQPISGMPSFVNTLGGGSIGWLPYSAVLVAVVAIAVTVFLTRIVWGRWIYAVGGNPEGSRRLGIPRSGVLVSVYVASGLLAGLAAVVTSGRLNAGSPTFGVLAELDSIAAVVIGGASFLGGRGHVGHALVGALMIGVIRNGMNLLNVEASMQLIVIGIVIVIAVETDVVRGRLEERFRTLKAAGS